VKISIPSKCLELETRSIQSLEALVCTVAYTFTLSVLIIRLDVGDTDQQLERFYVMKAVIFPENLVFPNHRLANSQSIPCPNP
jgi:hypothetical protein